MSEPERLSFTVPKVYTVPKICKCGRKWLGNSFKPAPADGSAVEHPCDDCIDAEEAAKKAALPRLVENQDAEPVKPRRTFGYDD